MGAARLVLLWCGAVIVACTCLAGAQNNPDPDTINSCYSGMAVIRLPPGPNECQLRNKKLLPLTQPMDFSTDLPWDCLESFLVSVEGCKVSMIPTKNSSDLLPGFACNWLEYQGYVESAHAGRVAVWTRPIPAAQWVLYNTNLTSWRHQGVTTLTMADFQSAVDAISARNPDLPVSEIMRQPEIAALDEAAQAFQRLAAMSAEEAMAAMVAAQQRAAEQQAAAADGTGAGRKLLQDQPAAAAAAAAEDPAPGTTPEVPSDTQGAAAPEQQAPSSKPPLPPGVEADVGNGLVSRPIGWQKILADVYKSNGSPIYADLVNNTIVLFSNQRCNLTYEVVSGGFLGVGTPDQSSIGKFALNAIAPYELPIILEVNKDVLATAAGNSNSLVGSSRQSSIAVITILSVLGAVLLASLIFLATKLARAPKTAAAAQRSLPFNDGVGHARAIAMSPLDTEQHRTVSPLEQQARNHGPAGGI